MLNNSARFQDLEILLVEDDPHTALLVSDFFLLQGAVITTAAKQQEATNLLKQNRFNVILCNLKLAEGDGYALISWLRQQEAELEIGLTPAIAVTASVREVDQAKVWETGFQAYLAKPHDFETLVKTVVDVLRDSSTLDAD